MDENRRRFLAKCGRFAAVTPVAMTLVMTASVSEPALAQSGTTSGTSRRPSRSSNGRFSLLDFLSKLF